MTFLGPGSFAFMGTFQIPLYDKHDNVVAHATVDEQDFARLSHLRFTALRTKSGIYGVQFRAVNGSTEATLLHRLVLGDPPFDGAEPFENAQVRPLHLTQPFLIRLREIVESSQKLGFGVVDRLK